MYIKGVGTVKKEEAMKFLTREGRNAVENGEITLEELGAVYKFELTKRASIIGSCQDTFNACYNRVPKAVIDKLSPEDLELLRIYFSCDMSLKKTAKKHFCIRIPFSTG